MQNYAIKTTGLMEKMGLGTTLRNFTSGKKSKGKNRIKMIAQFLHMLNG